MLYGYRQFLAYIKTNDIYKMLRLDVDVQTIFDTASYELDRPLPKGKNKK